ncbi:aminoacyl tRNA synthase complex-interacting multifunctional protein 1-like isoform X2 [Dunckerocampus dactyliophorus]|uniref:aminoacyl tRNA synthase complex-interacting multifunctional protein 1-like isoform X2 n=1 Tax=Dunckerocampus dactyliophorus TaxID=161453 RepID=UPI002405FD14|nr:aminoacyl tRNA synthase complex-interacting multifunctional protein 1-like isoform X2 [Dunckerocampus dactyliophorus]
MKLEHSPVPTSKVFSSPLPRWNTTNPLASFVGCSLVKMSSPNPLAMLEQRTAEADMLIEYLKEHVELLKENASIQANLRKEKKLLAENAKLQQDIDELKKQLLEREKNRGELDVSGPSVEGGVEYSSNATPPHPAALAPSATSAAAAVQSSPTCDDTKMKPEEKEKKPQPSAGQEDIKVDVSRLDLRVGRIVMAEKHPDTDSLYVELVDVGEPSPKTVVSGLVKHVPLEQMQNRMAVLLCNLTPAKMGRVTSQAMVMCASSPDKVEILDPPDGAVPGDKVTFQGFPGEPDKELNPKKKVWEHIQPDLRTDGECVATYKGTAFEVAGKGVCRAQTLSNSRIK